MDKSAAKKWTWLLLRLAATVGVILWIINTTLWRDHATLPDGRRLPVLAEGGGAVLLDESGRETSLDALVRPTLRAARLAEPRQPKSFRLDQLQQDHGEPVIEVGLGHSIETVRWSAALLAVAAFALAPFFQALRWRGLLRVQQVPLSVGMAAKLMWIGLLFNMFLLGAVGGDLVKAYYVSKHTHSRAESAIWSPLC